MLAYTISITRYSVILCCRTVFWPFLHCLYGHSTEQDPTVAKKCAMTANMDWDEIEACSTGSLGHK
jgi:hypothetical protein